MGYNKAAGEQVSASEFNSFLASAGLYGASNTGSDAYAITVDPAPNDYDAGDKYTFKADVGNTGPATLNVNGLGAKTIKKFGSTLDLETGDITAGQLVTVRYDGTYFQVEALARPTPFFQQRLPIPIPSGNNHRFGSNASGSVIYIYIQGYTSQELQRFERDSLTGMYMRTHGVDVSGVHLPGGSIGSLVVIGDYLYHVFSDGTNIDISRYSAADLTGVTAMTVPSITGAEVVAWTNGTDLYLVSGASNTTSRRWTVSGTTFTAASTATVTSDYDSFSGTSMWDGSNAFLVDMSSGIPGEFTIRKLTNIDGSSKTDTTKYIAPWDDITTSAALFPVIVNIDATKIYIGKTETIYDETGIIAYALNLLPISKP